MNIFKLEKKPELDKIRIITDVMYYLYYRNMPSRMIGSSHFGSVEEAKKYAMDCKKGESVRIVPIKITDKEGNILSRWSDQVKKWIDVEDDNRKR